MDRSDARAEDREPSNRTNRSNRDRNTAAESGSSRLAEEGLVGRLVGREEAEDHSLVAWMPLLDSWVAWLLNR